MYKIKQFVNSTLWMKTKIDKTINFYLSITALERVHIKQYVSEYELALHLET